MIDASHPGCFPSEQHTHTHTQGQYSLPFVFHEALVLHSSRKASEGESFSDHWRENISTSLYNVGSRKTRTKDKIKVNPNNCLSRSERKPYRVHTPATWTSQHVETAALRHHDTRSWIQQPITNQDSNYKKWRKFQHFEPEKLVNTQGPQQNWNVKLQTLHNTRPKKKCASESEHEEVP
jgi:hypothetical protein